ncbi:MAG: hypothetical protein GF317_06665 [Candidatus Lokiarchaeota archaeon]|nr:hypothetical protein [Candidatus Lokiarchaeota archaeon]MBD3199396.1 hypothetical protein [Candidatus Lokiarchaeota archaeon]
MIVKNRKRSKVYSIIILFALILNSMFIVAFLNNYTNTPDGNLQIDESSTLRIHSFSKEDFTSILDGDYNGLGNVTVLNISFYEKGFDNSSEYNDLDEDLSNGALMVNYNGTEFIDVINFATKDNLDGEYRNKISLKLNETLTVNYDNSSSLNGLTGFLVYTPRLKLTNVLDLYIDNTKIDEVNYSVDDDNFVVFNYFEYFSNSESKTFQLNLIWEYELTLSNWDISQLNANRLLVNQSMQNLTANYNYRFNIIGNKYAGNNSIDEGTELADNLELSLRISPYESNQLNNHSIYVKDEIVSDANLYLNDNNEINISLSDSFTADNSLFLFNFTADYQIKFLDPVSESWAIDRLVGNDNIRDRLYFPTVTSGPNHLILKFAFIESNIYYGQIKNKKSLFSRSFTYENVADLEDIELTQGIKIITPSLINGEKACPFTITYEADKSLRLVIVDNINMPLWGLNLKVYYHDALYGTYISKNITQSIAPLTADENGERILRNIPNGNYRIEIYQNGILIKTAVVNTNEEYIIITTSILHFPVVIIIFGTLSTFITLIGVYYYFKNKKR